MTLRQKLTVLPQLAYLDIGKRLLLLNAAN